MDQEFLFNRNISRNSSVGLSSRIYYCRSTAEGVPFNWEMQPGTPRDPPKEEAIPPISPPPAALSLGLPKLYLDQHSHHHHKPPTSPLKRLKFWRKSKKNKQQENHNAVHHDHNNAGVFGGSGRFEFCSSDSEFMASSTSSRNSSSSSSSSFSFSKGHLSRQCSRLRSTPARDSLSRSGHFSCNPWNFSSVMISIARRV